MTLTLTLQGLWRSKVIVSLDSPYMVSCWWLISNIGPNSAPLRDIRHWNPSDLYFGLSRSLKIKSDSVVGLAIYGFLLILNSNTEPKSTPLWDIRLWNPSDLDFDLSRSLKVKKDGVIGLAIYGILLMVNINMGPISAPIWDIRLWNPSDLERSVSRSPRFFEALNLV